MDKCIYNWIIINQRVKHVISLHVIGWIWAKQLEIFPVGATGDDLHGMPEAMLKSAADHFDEKPKNSQSVNIFQYISDILRIQNMPKMSIFFWVRFLYGFVWKCWVNIPNYSHLIGIMIINHWV